MASCIGSGYLYFLRFHQVIQRAFNWDDCHLFEFVDKVYDMDIRIANPDEKIGIILFRLKILPNLN